MQNELMKLALSHGIWSGLSITLIFYILNKQEKRDDRQDKREKKYQDIISKITDKLGIIEGVKKDVSDIKKYIKDLR